MQQWLRLATPSSASNTTHTSVPLALCLLSTHRVSRPPPGGLKVMQGPLPPCRPDMSFAVYGFVAKHDPPILCAQDLPGFLWESPWAESPLRDEPFGGCGGGWD